MNILQYGFMLYLSLILLAGIGKSANDIKEKDHLTELSQNIVNIILRYLESDTWVEYRLLNKACSTIITDIAFHQYSDYLTTPNHTLKNWNQLHQFVHNPRDLTITFPILPLLSFHNLRPPPNATKKDLVTFFRNTEGFAAKYVKKNQVVSYDKNTSLAESIPTLPLLYDPNQNMLHLYRIENEVVYSQHIRFPAMIILTDHPDKKPQKEWLSTWSIIQMTFNAEDNSCESISCQTKQSELMHMLVFIFNTEGIVEKIIKIQECEMCEFVSNDGNKGNTFRLQALYYNGNKGKIDYYTGIQALYALSSTKKTTSKTYD